MKHMNFTLHGAHLPQQPLNQIIKTTLIIVFAGLCKILCNFLQYVSKWSMLNSSIIIYNRRANFFIYFFLQFCFTTLVILAEATIQVARSWWCELAEI